MKAETTSPAHVLGAIEFAQYEHQDEHRGAMRVQNAPAFVPGCRACLALARAVQEARALVEAAAVVPPVSRVVPPARRATR